MKNAIHTIPTREQSRPPAKITRVSPRQTPGGLRRTICSLSALGLIIGLVVVACGGSATPTASPTILPTTGVAGSPSQQPSGTSAVATIAASPSPDLASVYTALSEKSNAAVDQCNKDRIAAGSSSLTKAKAAAAECLATYIGYVADLKAIDWGPVQPQADDVIAAMNKVDSLMEQMINASNASIFRAAYNQLPSAAAALLATASVLRAALGLSPVNP